MVIDSIQKAVQFSTLIATAPAVYMYGDFQGSFPSALHCDKHVEQVGYVLW